MGNRYSATINEEEAEEISKSTGFSKSQIQKLYHRFDRMDKLLYTTLEVDIMDERVSSTFSDIIFLSESNPFGWISFSLNECSIRMDFQPLTRVCFSDLSS